MRRVMSSIALVVAASTGAGAAAQTYKTVVNFAGADGASPGAGLLEDTKGNFWGTTEGGGTNDVGTVFKMTAAGTHRVVHDFADNGTDGYDPTAALIEDTKDNLWGTTSKGGTSDHGTLFKINAAGVYSVMHRFGAGADGATPIAGLFQDKNGNLWGTTFYGGTSHIGTVFEITAKGVYRIVHDFAGNAMDGYYPAAGLIQDRNGNLWGTTSAGGTGTNIYGTVFEITAAGAYHIVHDFALDGADGYYPYAALLQDRAGNFWGTALEGGDYSGGTVFKITAAGSFSVVYDFCRRTGCADGAFPQASLIEDTKGNFWGTASKGGTNNNAGTVFEITPKRIYRVVHDFADNGKDGYTPLAPLLQDKTGTLRGTTYSGGTKSDGTVFEITP